MVLAPVGPAATALKVLAPVGPAAAGLPEGVETVVPWLATETDGGASLAGTPAGAELEAVLGAGPLALMTSWMKGSASREDRSTPGGAGSPVTKQKAQRETRWGDA